MQEDVKNASNQMNWNNVVLHTGVTCWHWAELGHLKWLWEIMERFMGPGCR